MNTEDNDRLADLEGKIIGYAKDGIFAVIETVFGQAYLDINDTLDYRLQIGDTIEVEQAGWYISNGQIVTILGYEYKLNGHWHIIKEG